MEHVNTNTDNNLTNSPSFSKHNHCTSPPFKASRRCLQSHEKHQLCDEYSLHSSTQDCFINLTLEIRLSDTVQMKCGKKQGTSKFSHLNVST